MPQEVSRRPQIQNVSLGELEYSGDLSEQMLQCSEFLETSYRKMQTALRQKDVSDPDLEKHFRPIDLKLEWLVTAEALEGINQK